MPKHGAMKAYGGVDVLKPNAFLTMELDESQLLVSCSRNLSPRKEPVVPIGYEFLFTGHD